MVDVELLSPAKDLACGMAAIDHGADAVYIGAERFGARAAAGNSEADIAQLCAYAHRFGAKVYVTVNTIVYDQELADTQQLLGQLKAAGADAVLVQDMALLPESPAPSHPRTPVPPLPRPPVLPLHASTQTDNRTVDKVKWLHGLGFRRVVLARELSVDDIKAIHRAVPGVELEVFVHGALCVSYSGQCYASQHCFRRSANRGECAQFCRLKFDLVDADGNVLERGRHLLSLRDMCRIDALEQLLEAGAVSFKIEGRLKDMAYVKNVTAAYSRRLNEIIARHPEKYRRSSMGTCTYTFTPNLQKTFNRGFTQYFLNGRRADIFSPDTPKALGEYVGRVKELRGSALTVAGTASFANGDGLCFFNEHHELEGFRVNRAEGNRLFPFKMPQHLKAGVALYRNQDVAFERMMAGPTAVRKVAVRMQLRALSADGSTEGYVLTMTDERGRQRSAAVNTPLQQAQTPQRANIIRQLSKLGGTPFVCQEVDLPADFNYFIPSSLLAELRRKVVDAWSETPLSEAGGAPACRQEPVGETAGSPVPSFPRSLVPPPKHAYLLNIANRRAQAFYAQQGVKDIRPAFELQPVGGALLMQCRHCLRYSMGCCTKNGGRKPAWREPLSLRMADGRCFKLEFDCKNCQMNVYGGG